MPERHWGHRWMSHPRVQREQEMRWKDEDLDWLLFDRAPLRQSQYIGYVLVSAFHHCHHPWSGLTQRFVLL